MSHKGRFKPKNYEKYKIDAFYKDIDYNKVKDASEVQIFRNVKVKKINKKQEKK